MDLIKDRWPIVCQLAKDDPLGCDGVNEFGTCTVFINDAVKAKERTGCAFKDFHAPITMKSAVKIRVGQQKQTKRRVKAGTIAVAE